MHTKLRKHLPQSNCLRIHKRPSQSWIQMCYNLRSLSICLLSRELTRFSLWMTPERSVWSRSIKQLCQKKHLCKGGKPMIGWTSVSSRESHCTRRRVSTPVRVVKLLIWKVIIQARAWCPLILKSPSSQLTMSISKANGSLRQTSWSSLASRY